MAGIEFIYGNTRGNTYHRFDLWDKDGKAYIYGNIYDEDDEFIKRDFIRTEEYDWEEIPEYIFAKQVPDCLGVI